MSEIVPDQQRMTLVGSKARFSYWLLVLITSANVLDAYLSSSYDKAKHIVEVDDRILSVFIVDPNDSVSDLFIALNANIDESFVEKVRDSLNIKFEEQPPNHPLGAHLWNILEYDMIRVIRIYEPHRLIVVLAKSHTSPGDIAETVLGYLYESEEEQPKSLF